jgi:hypothetical protein
MSTGADCQFVQRQDGWYLLLQRYPYGETEDYDTYGPFPTQPIALKYLDEHFANPGGYSVQPLDDHVCQEFDNDGHCLICGARNEEISVT